MRILALSLQVTGMALCPPALVYGLFVEHGMGMELTLMFVGLGLFYAGRALEPQAKA